MVSTENPQPRGPTRLTRSISPSWRSWVTGPRAGRHHLQVRGAEPGPDLRRREHSQVATSSLGVPCPLPHLQEAGAVRTGPEVRDLTPSLSCPSKFSPPGQVEVRRTEIMGEVKTGTILLHLPPEVEVAGVLRLPGQEDQEVTQHLGPLRPPPLMGVREAAAVTAGARCRPGEEPLPRPRVGREARVLCRLHQWVTRGGAGLPRAKARARASQANSLTSWELRHHPLLQVR